MYDSFKDTYILNAQPGDKKNIDSCNIASFDLDNTIIKYKQNTMNLVYGVKEKLEELYNNNYKIVIFTNQCGTKFNKIEFNKQINKLAIDLEVPLQVYVCNSPGYCKKPSMGLWKLLELNNGNIPINFSKSFYVGDASGRIVTTDKSIDYKFAINIGIKYYIPDEYFDDCKIRLIKPVHPLSSIKSYDDENIDDEIVKMADLQKTMIILVGPPGSGKSTWCNQEKFKKYTVISHDRYPIKSKFITLIKQGLLHGQNVIVDRRNEYTKDRKELIEIAKDYSACVKIVWFDIPKNICEHICAYREIIEGRELPQIIISKYYSKTKGFEMPNTDECQILIKHFNLEKFDKTYMNIFINFLI